THLVHHSLYVSRELWSAASASAIATCGMASAASSALEPRPSASIREMSTVYMSSILDRAGYCAGRASDANGAGRVMRGGIVTEVGPPRQPWPRSGTVCHVTVTGCRHRRALRHHSMPRSTMETADLSHHISRR